MSHYTLGVVMDKLDEGELEELLAPYSENLEVEPYIDITKEEIINNAKQRKNEFLKAIEKGEELKDWQQAYISATTDEELYNLERYEDEEFDENGNQLSRYNPLSKWDWYVVGGRWGGALNVNGEWVDYGKIKEIRLDEMPAKKQMIYDEALLFWKIFVDEEEPANEEEKEFKNNEFCLFKKEYYLDRYKTKEHYAKMCSTWFTHALLYNGQWYESGEMGWFGCDDSTQDSEIAYLKKFNEILHNPDNQEKYFVVVDCHI